MCSRTVIGCINNCVSGGTVRYVLLRKRARAAVNVCRLTFFFVCTVPLNVNQARASCRLHLV